MGSQSQGDYITFGTGKKMRTPVILKEPALAATYQKVECVLWLKKKKEENWYAIHSIHTFSNKSLHRRSPQTHCKILQ